jgi:dihydroorotase
VAGGTTSFIEQPNTKPPALTLEALEEKYQIASQDSMANYGFNMGVSNDNIDELLKMPEGKYPGIKIFMGSSTGNMLVDDQRALERIFSEVPQLIITHCEDEQTIRDNMAKAVAQYGEDIPFDQHPVIRSEEACYLSSSFAVELAKKHNSRLHVYHISTARETDLFQNDIPLEEKRITAEACIHHLWFDDSHYATKGSLIKWNPAVKTAADREGIWKAVVDGRIDVIATDHAPHTLEEKQNAYAKAPAGGPLVQHGLVAMLEFVRNGEVSLSWVVEKMCHNPAKLFRISERGFLREGYFADMVLVDPSRPWTVKKDNILYKCGWSPFEGTTFKTRIEKTIVNGQVVYDKGKFNENFRGERLEHYTV